ncbi:hypothetical protein Hamer_G007466 [Homarus americanus]|uniref:Uncharacterized protein n=1 Tax=Homarus americanus TaxID=6706 RepID=A0A8J5MSE9_HOMAM|nr:hypothetical protein Hamer_G007466 [Homarus americanus]
MAVEKVNKENPKPSLTTIRGVKKRKYPLEMKREMLKMIKSSARTCESMQLSDSDQALPVPANQEEEGKKIVDDPTPSTSPPHNHEMLSVCPYYSVLCKAQPVNALANITLGDDDGTTDDDSEVLGDLLMEELPQDVEGFDAEFIMALKWVSKHKHMVVSNAKKAADII